MSWQSGKEEESFAYWPCHLTKGKFVWGRPRAADVGGEAAKTAWRVKGVMHMLLDTEGD